MHTQSLVSSARRPRLYSQTGQDFWVIGEVFNQMRAGYFLELGAADGMTLSNTYLLEQEYGWKGICIEADSEYFSLLRQRRTATCVQACVDGVAGEAAFARRELLGGMIDAGLDNAQVAASDSYETVHVTTRTLASVLKESQAPQQIDYFSIDVEGAEDRILCGFPFHDYQFNCMTIERPKPALREVLSRHGYIVIKEIPGYDVFYVHQSFQSTYLENVFAFWANAMHEMTIQAPPCSRSPQRSWWSRLAG